MVDFNPKLNADKILSNIKQLKIKLNNIKVSEYELLHEEILLFCRIICTKKQDFKEITGRSQLYDR
jgi:hypothetical protein